MSERKQGRTLGPLYGWLGPWRFRVDPGVSVGGGAFCQVRLEDGEDVLDYGIASHRLTWRPLSYGFLSLTDRRLIFTPFRWPISPLEGHPTAFELAGLSPTEVEQHIKPDLVPPLADAVVIRTGKDAHLFYVRSPNAWRAAINERIELAKESAP